MVLTVSVARFVVLAELKIALFRVVADVTQAPNEEIDVWKLAANDGFADSSGNAVDEREGSRVQFLLVRDRGRGYRLPSHAPFVLEDVVKLAMMRSRSSSLSSRICWSARPTCGRYFSRCVRRSNSSLSLVSRAEMQPAAGRIPARRGGFP